VNAQYQIQLARLPKWQAFSQLPKEKAADNEQCGMLKIENLTVTEKALTLDYQVVNPFMDDIWICEDIDTEGKYDAETRIDAETVWIKLRFNLESNFLRDPPAIAKYLRLPPGESHSGRIILDLPVRNASPVYAFREDRKRRKQIVLHRAVFEVGYFEGEFVNRVSEQIEQVKRYLRGTKFQDSQTDRFIREEVQDGQLCKFLYLRDQGQEVRIEKSAKVVVADVDIPCSAVVDNK